MTIPPTRPLHAVVFDFGDTLFTHPDGADLLVARGWTAEEAEAAIEGAWRESKTPQAMMKNRDRDPDSHRRGWLELLQPIEDRSPGMAEVLYQKTILTPGWVPYPDTAPVLRELRRRRVPVQVLSNVAEPLTPLMERHELAGAVDGYTLSYEHAREKPDPELFRIACRALGTDPGETLMVGDSYLADGAAALIGMPVLLLPMVPRGAVRGLAHVLDLVSGPGAG
ncbi:MAG: HAD family hydrolase [Candidatus Dormibacteraeota bacterium]|nr:HAD family hydrolase [Candidatus Dormibacteraeota bacterium]